jgi:signal transduction histidine kinase
VDPSFPDSLKAYVGFTARSSAVLRGLHALVAPHFAAIVEDFYATIEANPEARGAITGGAAQIARLKQTLVRWLEELFQGPHDAAYFERRARIGRVHVRIELPQAYMFTALDRIRVRVGAVIRAGLADDPAALEEAVVAVDQMMDIELCIMLETYREDLMARNRTSERLATIGQFAAGIGHELRNPLGVIESSVFLLRQHLEQAAAEPPVARHLDKIEAEVKRSNKTIADLLELARTLRPQPRPVALGTLIRAALAVAALPPDVAVSVACDDSLHGILDFDQIVRVLTNLLVNASQAMDGKGAIRVEAERAAGETRLRVQDSGPGVPVQARPRIFEALFTTKAKGIGLGLALCRRIAEAHGGSIVLEPSATGASFLVVIPDQPLEAS